MDEVPNPQNYPVPAGLHVTPAHLLDLRSDSEIDEVLLHPRPVTDEKNVWFFWHTGFINMHPYTQRNVRAWHRRLSKHGWVIRVIDRQPSSPLNVENFLDVNDPGTFPRAFCDGTIGGDYAPQHTSDLVRWPLLLKYGGVYADAGMMQIGDLNRLWMQTLGNPNSKYEVLSYCPPDDKARSLTNYFLCSNKNNRLFELCHRLLLALWAADGGKTNTEGMHSSPLVNGLPMMGGDFSIVEEGKTIGPEEAGRMLTDYIIQGQVMTMVMGLIDEELDWNGPQYCSEHVYAVDFMSGSQLINEYTEWNGRKAFELMSLALPKEGEAENQDQSRAREIVEGCLQRSFGFKLAHGLILRVFKETLGSLWRANPGSDDVPGTYAHWLRYAITYWNQDEVPPTREFKIIPPFKRGPLLRGA